MKLRNKNRLIKQGKLCPMASLFSTALFISRKDPFPDPWPPQSG